MNDSVLEALYATVVNRKENPQEGSYTCYLFDKGRDKIFMGEENAKRIRFLLEYLSINGEKKALDFYTRLYKEYKKDNTFDVLSYIER